ncbi:hypothetical protein ACHQM5_018583 [Ranunculus cassubicifolius]
MARFNLESAISFTIFTIFFSQFLISNVNGDLEDFGKRLSLKKLGLRRQKLSQFRFYFQEIVTPPTPTAVVIVRAPNSTANTGFGTVTMIDNALTIGPELNSTLVGRAQGLYAAAAQNETALFTAMNFVFVEGKYNGSTISILGRNPVMNAVREMPIIGGSGLFRFARGYAELRTEMFNMATGDATVEYTLYVMHY